MNNFTFINQQMLAHNAIIQLPPDDVEKMSGQLSDTIHQLLSDKEQQQALGGAAYQVVQMNQGASQISVKALKTFIVRSTRQSS